LIDKIYEALVSRYIFKRAKDTDFDLEDEKFKVDVKNCMLGIDAADDIVMHNIEHIKKKISSMIDGLSDDDIESFAIFKLKQFNSDLEKLFDYCCDLFMSDSAFNQLNDFLKLLSNEAESRVDTLRLLFDDKNKVMIIDENMKNITCEIVKEHLLIDIEENDADAILSFIICVAPKKLKLYDTNKIDKDVFFLKSLMSIFEGRIEIVD
jgi:hypothetical protein